MPGGGGSGCKGGGWGRDVGGTIDGGDGSELLGAEKCSDNRGSVKK